MKVSIITAVYNNALTLEETLKSVRGQSYEDVEHIIVDGGSTDGTTGIIERYQNDIAMWVSEPDHGMYDALNKGIAMASGNIVGFLHADDLYADDGVIEKIVNAFSEHNSDSCYGDLEYVSRGNTGNVIRYWKAGPYREGLLQKGWMPPHPTFFVKREVYDSCGYFDTGFKIAADYELMLRFLGKNRITTQYIPDVLVRMRLGGLSNRSIRNILLKTYEDQKAWRKNDLSGSLYAVFMKNISKLPQFVMR